MTRCRQASEHLAQRRRVGRADRASTGARQLHPAGLPARPRRSFEAPRPWRSRQVREICAAQGSVGQCRRMAFAPMLWPLQGSGDASMDESMFLLLAGLAIGGLAAGWLHLRRRAGASRKIEAARQEAIDAAAADAERAAAERAVLERELAAQAEAERLAAAAELERQAKAQAEAERLAAAQADAARAAAAQAEAKRWRRPRPRSSERRPLSASAPSGSEPKLSGWPLPKSSAQLQPELKPNAQLRPRPRRRQPRSASVPHWPRAEAERRRCGRSRAHCCGPG